MQLLKRRAGGTGAGERADEADSAVADAAPAERTTPDTPTTPTTPATPDTTAPTSGEHPVRSRWRRTVTVPVTVPRRSIRQTVTVPSRSVERTTTPGLRVGPILAVAAGAVLAVVGAVALLRAGVDESWFTPQVQVLDADHTALLGIAEIGAGLLLLLAGLSGSRVLVAVLGLALALGATAVAIDPGEVSRELAIESWWAWVLVAAGAVLTLAALQAPHERQHAVVDVS
jgi:hypothetical protein